MTHSLPSSTSSATAYHGPVVHSLGLTQLQVLPSALVLVVDGQIASLDEDVKREEVPALLASRGVEAELVLVDEGFLCPGLIDTHTHAPQYPNNGLGGALELLPWLQTLTFPLESRFSDPALAERIFRRVIARTLSAGTTTSCYYSTLHVDASVLLAQLCAELGQRAFVGRCSMNRYCADDYVEASTAASMASTKQFLAAVAGLPSTVKPILTPRFALSCTPDLLTELGDLAAATGLPVQTHLAENTSEIAEIRRLFPESKTYAGVYAAHGLLTPRTILAHAVHLDDAEREVISSHGAGISHCPGSNTNLNSGAARVLDMLGAGIKVGLGSDCSGGCGTGILPQIRDARTVSRGLAFEGLADRGLSIPELFHMATLGGASLCGLEDVGNFTPGKQFDALWVKPRSPGMWVDDGEAVGSVFEKWLFTGDDRDIAAVWVQGRRVAGSEQ
ncbi:hypothetical protein Q8F55_004755 [Vanrija albida]|uniref:Amidohydrolase-related domain-containing protein n=1 Tax=Vanrija albida TaxID=181172 RepID=A0ABR3Q0P4_9TREE